MWILAPFVLSAALVQSAAPGGEPNRGQWWFGPGDVINEPPPAISSAPPPNVSRPVPAPASPETRRVRDQRIVGAIALAALALVTIASTRLRMPVVLRR